MKNVKFLILLAAFLFIAVATQAQNKTGKDIFTTYKCSMCHNIQSQGITSKGKAPDLSNVGAEQKADFFPKFLKKEAKLNDKNHPISFSGTEDEFKTLTTWLASLKKPAAK